MSIENRPQIRSISVEIAKLFEEDQADRTLIDGDWNDPERAQKMMDNDAMRLRRAREIYHDFLNGKLGLSGSEMVKVAFIFQHSLDPEDYLIAKELSELADDKTDNKWLAAAAEDRYLLATGHKQKWGTQFNIGPDGEHMQAPMETDEESGITDDMRRARDIPPRDQQLREHLKLIAEDTAP